MPPRTFTNPAPKTESAREAAKNFFCELCQKGYQRHNEYEAHMSSFMHSSGVRLKDMKGMSKDPQAAEKARRAERARDKEAGLVKLDMSAAATSASSSAKPSGGGFKKGGFKSAFGGGGGGGDYKKSEEAAGAAQPPPAKGGFKKVFGGGSGTSVDAEKKEEAKMVEREVRAGGGGAGGRGEYGSDGEETDSDEDLGYEKYDPAHPTGCRDPGCNCRENLIQQTVFPV